MMPDGPSRGAGFATFGKPRTTTAIRVDESRRRAPSGPLIRAAIDDLFHEGQLLAYAVGSTGVVVTTLLDRGAESDVAEAAAIERLAAAPAEEGFVIRDIWLLRPRALPARAHGDAAAYAHFRDRYRDMARRLGFEGHIAWAGAMP
jgi:hypothetical protein